MHVELGRRLVLAAVGREREPGPVRRPARRGVALLARGEPPRLGRAVERRDPDRATCTRSPPRSTAVTVYATRDPSGEIRGSPDADELVDVLAVACRCHRAGHSTRCFRLSTLGRRGATSGARPYARLSAAPASEPRVRKTIQNMPGSLPPGGRRKRLYPESHAGVAELVDATGLGPVGPHGPWRFKSSRPHCRPDAVRDRGDHREPDGGDAGAEDCVPHGHRGMSSFAAAASRSFYLERVISSMRAAARSSARVVEEIGRRVRDRMLGPVEVVRPAGGVQRVADRDLVADDEHRLRRRARAARGAPRA